MGSQEIAQSIGWLGETWGFWLQTGAFFVSALAAVAVIYYNGKQARLRALIDLLVHQKIDKELVEATPVAVFCCPNEQSPQCAGLGCTGQIWPVG